MTRLQALEIARTPDRDPEHYTRLVQIAVILDTRDEDKMYGVEFMTDYHVWTEYDAREARETLRELR